MYRFLLTPRWWAINLFVIASIPFCLSMGSWQLSRFEDRASAHQEREAQVEVVAEQRAKPLVELMPVDKETSGKVARARGTFDTEHQFLSPDRELDGEKGSYVVSLLRTDDGGPIKGSGEQSVLPVVRGWLPADADPAAVPPPPTGQVTVSGALQPSETTGGQTGLPEGQLDRISAASLVNLVPYDVYNAWITIVDPEQLQPPLEAVPPVAPKDTGLDLKAFQNLGYTAEWFVFAGFVLFMWLRFFRREVEVVKDARLGFHPDGGPPGPAGVSRKPTEPATGTDAEEPGTETVSEESVAGRGASSRSSAPASSA